MEQESHNAGDDHAGGSSPQGPAYALPITCSRGKQFLAFQPRNVKSPANGSSDEETKGCFHAYQSSRTHEHEIPFEEDSTLVPVAEDMLLDRSKPSFSSCSHGDGISGGEKGRIKKGFGLSRRLFAFRIENFEGFRRSNTVWEPYLFNVDHLAFHRNGHGDTQYGNEKYPGEGSAKRHVLSCQQEQGGYGRGEGSPCRIACRTGSGLHACIFQNSHGGFGNAQAHKGVPEGKRDNSCRQSHPKGPSHFEVGVQISEGKDGA